MKTQAISNQHFTAGNIKFVNRHFVNKPFDMISEYLPEQLDTTLKEASKKLKGKDYDIFVTRNRDNNQFFEIRADKNYLPKTKQKPVLVHENVIKSAFTDAVDSAIEAYENAIKTLN